ncbi:MAG: TonB-dependent receptor, partial [Chitinophagaceae bacterium]|nr:TonB-dependent receptor [Chitinophagaceae bacterium]
CSETSVSYQLLANNLIVLKSINASAGAPPVTGRVVSSTGEPIAGVSVTIKGSGSGTSTDADGNFSITVPDGATLVFSSVGFAQQEIKVSGETPLNIKMQAATSSMDEVVVVGYGTQRRTDLTGSIASVKGADIARQQVLTATQAIQGKVAGVQIISSGEPNSLPIVRVRGAGSMLGGANPLYVVDGVITDDIRNINTADIVSMDILKDASATAIYGMRAANGVLLITTKKGRTGRMIVAYDGSVGVNEAANLVNMAGANQYAGYLNEASIYYGTGDSAITEAKLAGGYNTDWYDAILRRGFQQNHNVSLSGGNEKITYFFSAGYLSQQGLLKTNDLNRFTLRSNNEYKINNIVKLSTLLSYSRTDLDSALLNAFGNAYRDAPYIPAKAGNLYGNTSLSNNVGNALLGLDKNNNNGVGNRVQGTIALDIKPLSWLTFRSSYGVDMNFYKQAKYGYVYLNSGSDNVFVTAGGNEKRERSTLEAINNSFNKWVWDNTLTATKSFGGHNFILLAGTTSEKFKFNELSGKRFDVPANSSQWYLGAGNTQDQTNNNTGDLWSRNSYITRLNYNFNNTYLLTATFRADGTSRFASSNRWGYFPSVGAAWNIAKENFMSSQKIFDNLKLRASYGRVGNDQVSTTAYRPIAGINVPYYFDQPTNQYLGIRLDDLADENVKWEITDEIDIGLDFSLLNKRLSGEIDLYDKKTKDALVLVNVPGILGDPDSKYITNAANFENKGIELSLNWADNIGKDWSYSVSGNIAYNKNQIINLNGGQALFSGAIGDYFTTKSDNGQPIGSFFLRQVDGVFKTTDEIAASAQKTAVPGDLRYRDISGPDGKPDGVIDDNDRVYSGSYLPKVTYGISGNVGFMGIDLSIGTYGTAGGKIYNGKKNLRGSDPLDNLETVEAVNRWTPNHTNTNVPRASFGKLPASTYFLEKGDFFRINNLTLGYTLPRTVLSGIHATNLRVYATVQNLATFTKYSGFTPEILPGAGTVSDPGVLSAGVDTNTYPTTRVWALGVNLSF